MDKEKMLDASRVSKADPEKDMELINRFAVRQLSAQEVFCFSVVLCDNDVDRDGDRFTAGALEELAKLFVGKTCIFDHSPTAKNQIARLYRARLVEQNDKATALGDTLLQLRGDAYMLRSAENQGMIDAIEAGILKEVSVSCSIRKCSCSVCGGKMFGSICENGHELGERYDGALCARQLDEPADAFELSFVAVPAQRAAGVTKGKIGRTAALLEELLAAQSLTGCEKQARALIPRLQMLLAGEEERKLREAILERNKPYLRRKDEDNDAV